MATELKEARIKVRVDVSQVSAASEELKADAEKLKEEKEKAPPSKSKEQDNRDREEKNRKQVEGGLERIKSEAVKQWEAALDSIPFLKQTIEGVKALVAQRDNLQKAAAVTEGIFGEDNKLVQLLNRLIADSNAKIDKLEAKVGALKEAPGQALQIEMARARLGITADVGRAMNTIDIVQQVGAAEAALDRNIKRKRDADAVKAFTEAIIKGINK